METDLHETFLFLSLIRFIERKKKELFIDEITKMHDTLKRSIFISVVLNLEVLRKNVSWC